jgi:hypothetical protein
MTREKLFPLILIILDLAAALVYAFTSHDIRKVVYWLAAAILSITVTF